MNLRNRVLFWANSSVLAALGILLSTVALFAGWFQFEGTSNYVSSPIDPRIWLREMSVADNTYVWESGPLGRPLVVVGVALWMISMGAFVASVLLRRRRRQLWLISVAVTPFLCIGCSYALIFWEPEDFGGLQIWRITGLVPTGPILLGLGLTLEAVALLSAVRARRTGADGTVPAPATVAAAAPEPAPLPLPDHVIRRRILWAVGLFILLLVVIIGWARLAQPSFSWSSTEAVDGSSTDVWVEEMSLALDVAGRPHLSYYGRISETAGILGYVWFDGSTWHNEVVDSIGRGEPNSLALDTAGLPHISYLETTDGTLKYAHYDGTQWQIETIASGLCSWTGRSSLVVDRWNQPHISYCTCNQWYNACDDLMYAHNAGSGWEVETVDERHGGDPSLVLDDDGYPHISYCEYFQDVGVAGYDYWFCGRLKYAYYDGHGWLRETVDDPGYAGYDSSLVLDRFGRPVIAYISGGDIKLATYDGHRWHRQILGWGGDFLGDISLALDAQGRPQIVFSNHYRDGGYTLKYARYNGLLWQVGVVDSEGILLSASLVLDAAGRPHVGYANGIDLRYAYSTEGR